MLRVWGFGLFKLSILSLRTMCIKTQRHYSVQDLALVSDSSLGF